MPYRYREDIVVADAAFEAWGKNPEEVFIASADALLNVMVDDLESISPVELRVIHCDAENLEILLLRLLEELVWLKDAEQLLFRLSSVEISSAEESCSLDAEAYGEKLNAEKHALSADVKAVTMYRFKLEQTKDGWNATVVLDI